MENMEALFKSSLVRNLSLALALLVGAGYLLKDKALEFWLDEIDHYNKLDEAQFVPDLSARNLTEKQTVTVLLFGDAGAGTQAQHDVASGMWKYCEKSSCDLAIVLGDNIYPSGVTSAGDPLFKTHFESPYRKFVAAADRDFWMLVGNHDRRSSIDAQLRYSDQSPIWKMPAQDYAIPGLPGWLNIYVLDTTFIAKGADIPTFQSAFEKNFQAQLERASSHLCDKTGWRILATHHPLVSNGAKNNRFREDNVYDALHRFIEECGIHLFFSGHEHLQQHVQMGGVDYLIQGAASSTRTRKKPLQRESAISYYLGYELGFGHLTFTEEKIDIRFNDSGGRGLYTTSVPFADHEARRTRAADNFQ